MKRRRPALKVEADYRILVDPYIPPPPPGPAARWRRWLVVTGLLLLLVALGAGAWWLVQRAGKPAPGPAAAPVASAVSNVTAEAEAEPEIPEVPPGMVEAPGAGEEPEAPACLGGIVVQAQTPVAAQSYFQKTAKRYRLETNAWASIPALPHILTNQGCGMAEVGFEAYGFRSEPASRRLLVQEGRTNDANFTLHPLPATLIVTCNVTNAELRITNHVSRIPDPVSVPSFQPVTLTVSAPGYRDQTLTLGPFDPLTTNRQAVTLEREVGALRIEAEVPTNALAYFQGLEKRLRIASNDWKTVSLPHVEEGLECVEMPVELAVAGFGTANERELTRMKVEDGRTNTVVFRLEPKPATLTITCNVTNAVIALHPETRNLTPDTFAIPSLQPVSVTVSATGYVAQTLALGPYNPLTTNRQAVKLEPEAKPEPPPAAAAPAGKPGETMTVDLGGGVKMEMVWIPPGEFTMGSPAGEAERFSDEGPRHRVTMFSGFWMGKYEVTQRQYQQLMGDNPSYFKYAGEDAPVERVDWNQAKAFCERLQARLPAEMRGKPARLPTEAEWEYACRAGTTTALNNGKPLTSSLGRCPNLDEVAWYNENSGRTTHPVGQKKPNAWGLYDMHGNVWEWCKDWYHDSYNGAPEDGSAWLQPSGSGRVLRGGSWGGDADFCRSAGRGGRVPGGAGSRDGFRVIVLR